jgi:ribosomal protein L11 methyltransferase
MQAYLEFTFDISPIEPWNDILASQLIEYGFDSFAESPDGIMAYIQKDLWTDGQIDDLWLLAHDEVNISYTYQEMPNINWNEEWEKNFTPINIEDKVLIRAEFHPTQNLAHEIVIQPKMSFGTGHHATTYMMIKNMYGMDFTDKKVLDMGCGTSVLAIFALQKGAKEALAIDIDEWSVVNSAENAQRNQVTLRVIEGTAKSLGQDGFDDFDTILANINRNILMADLATYVSCLKKGGTLLLSGICDFDEKDITEHCQSLGLTPISRDQRNEWMCLGFAY